MFRLGNNQVSVVAVVDQEGMVTAASVTSVVRSSIWTFPEAIGEEETVVMCRLHGHQLPQIVHTGNLLLLAFTFTHNLFFLFLENHVAGLGQD